MPMPDTPWEFACRWYRESEIEHKLNRQKRGMLADAETPVPSDIHSKKFANWLTNEYRLAMAKGIQIGLGMANAGQPELESAGPGDFDGDPDPLPTRIRNHHGFRPSGSGGPC